MKLTNISSDQLRLAEIMIDRNLSRLYVEVYKKDTGFHSISEMKEDIEKKNLIIGDKEDEIANLNMAVVEHLLAYQSGQEFGFTYCDTLTIAQDFENKKQQYESR